MILEFPARCVKCRAIMAAGTDAEFIRDGETYEHFHSGECPEAPKRRRTHWDIRYCSRRACPISNGYGFRVHAPAVCRRCGARWLTEAEAEAA